MPALLLLTLLAVQQSPPQTAVGTLVVTVVEAETGIPLESVQVWVRRRSTDGEGLSPRTDLQGAVSLQLEAGRYDVQARSATHLSVTRRPALGAGSFFGRAAPSNPAATVDILDPGIAVVTVFAGGTQRMTFRLARGGEVTGRLVDAGRPVARVLVELVTFGERKVLGHPIVGTNHQVESDAEGRFRFSGLFPGSYYLRAHPPGEGHLNSIYYPGEFDVLKASPIVVGANAGDELLFSFKHVPAVRIAGRVIDTSRNGVQEIRMRRMDQDTGDSINYEILPLKSDGNWFVPTTSGVHALLYTRRASVGGRLLAAAWRVIYVGDKPVSDIELRAVPAASMSGLFEFAGGPGPAELDPPPSIFLRPEGVEESIRWGLADGGDMAEGNAFRLAGIFGTSTVDVTEPEGWIAEAVLLPDGRNILDRNFTFEPGKHYEGVRAILTNRIGTIRGSVGPEVDRTRGGLMVVAFPEEEALRKHRSYVKAGHVEDDGRFTVSNLRPGTSYIVSTCDWPCGPMYDAEGLEALAATAARIYIDRPGTFTVTLKR